MRILLALVIVGLLFAAACAPKGAQHNQADIDRAVHEYLAKKPGLSGSSMVVEVKHVEYAGDSAEAQVVIRSKSNPEASMNMTYVLKRSGAGSWQVQGPKTGAQAQHGEVPKPEGPSPSEFGPPNPRNLGAPSATVPQAAPANPHQPATPGGASGGTTPPPGHPKK